MSIRKIKTSTGEVKWEVRVRAHGRGTTRINRRFEKKADAEKFADEFKEQKKNVSLYEGMQTFEETTFQKEAEHWQSVGTLDFSHSHHKRTVGILKEVLPIIGRLSPAKITPEFMAKFQREQKQRKLKNSTINRKTEVICAILNFAVRQRRIPYNPASGYRKLASSSEEMLFWEKPEALSFLAYANMIYPKGSKHHWVYVVYLLAVNTGLRAGEVWGLQPQDIVLDENSATLFIRRQWDKTKMDFSRLKGKSHTKSGKKSRHVPCNSVLLGELLNLIKEQNIQPTETIFQTSERTPICHDNFIKRHFMADQEEWGGKRIRFHDLRHTAVTLLLAGGVDIKTVQEIAGHEDMKTTMNYIHLLGHNIKRVAENFSIIPNQILSNENRLLLLKSAENLG